MKPCNWLGSKRSQSMDALHFDRREKFERISKLGVKFNLSTFRQLTQDIFSDRSRTYSSNVMDLSTDQLHHTKITLGWIQSFANFFSYCQLLKYCESSYESTEGRGGWNFCGFPPWIDLCTSFFSLLSPRFLDKKDVQSANKTHFFIINVENARTLGFFGSSEVKYAYFGREGEAITMMAWLSGVSDAYKEPLFLVFRNIIITLLCVKG